ncbi:MAG: YvcK family protein, partial [Chloroflexi bacterium]|nr:YvcK family protein [Chloroflexota bacterium]
PVRTVLSTPAGDLAMQEYFVRLRSEPQVSEVKYQGAERAKPSPGFRAALEDAGQVVLCPSNPFLSVGPILAVPGVRAGLESFSGPRVAVSPIVGGAALRGPAAKIMSELGQEVSSVGVARQYQGISDFFLIDNQDSELAPAVAALGMTAITTSIIMDTEADKVSLAEQILTLGAGQTDSARG